MQLDKDTIQKARKILRGAPHTMSSFMYAMKCDIGMALSLMARCGAVVLLEYNGEDYYCGSAMRAARRALCKDLVETLKRATTPLSHIGLANGSGYSKDAVRRVTTLMRDAGLIHVAGWRLVSNNYAALWALGFKDDAAKPTEGKTRSESNIERHRKRMLTDPEYAIKMKQKYLKRRTETKRVIESANNLPMAFFGK